MSTSYFLVRKNSVSLWSYFPERLCSCSRSAGSQGAGTFLSTTRSYGLFLLTVETTDKLGLHYLHWSKDASHRQCSEVGKYWKISNWAALVSLVRETVKYSELFGSYLLLNKVYWKSTSAFYYQRFWFEWSGGRTGLLKAFLIYKINKIFFFLICKNNTFVFLIFWSHIIFLFKCWL